MSAPHPQVIRNPDLKELVNSVYCRPQYLGNLMLTGGMSEAEVRAMSIVFSAEAGFEATYDDTATYGLYNHAERQITVNLGPYQDTSYSQQLLADKPGVYKRKFADRLAQLNNEGINETIFHEIKHAIDWHTWGDEVLKEEFMTHDYRIYNRRLSRANILGSIAGLGLVGFMTEMYTMHNKTALEWSLMSTLGAGAVASAFAVRLQNKATTTHRSHKDYLSRPWEVRAREYGKTQLQQLLDANRPLPIRVDFKAVRALSAF